MDNATLKANVLPAPVRGRDEIEKILTALETLYVSLEDIHRTSTSEREFIFSQARLLSGEKITINIVGVRDKSGWIANVIMNHAPDAAMHSLSIQLSEILHPGSRAA